MTKAWKDVGGLDPIQTKKGGTFEGRFIGIQLKLAEFDDRGKKIKGKCQKMFLASVYHPYDKTHQAFNTELNDILTRVPQDFDIIMGGDMNAQVGRREIGIDEEGAEFNDVLGPFGIETRNKKGKDLLQIYQANNLRILNTYFESPSHVTYVSFNKEKSKCMLDTITASKSVYKKVIYCRAVNDGIRSDHSAIK